MLKVKKLTPQERKDRVKELKAYQQPLLDKLGVSDAIYIPKMAHNVAGLEGLHMGFFESELSNGDVYTEKVSIRMESEDPSRTLYKWNHNPHFKEDYEKSEPASTGDCRYFIPVDELEIMEEPKEELDFDIPNPDGDCPMEQMTMKDHAAITWMMPVSDKKWLNDLIKSIKK